MGTIVLIVTVGLLVTNIIYEVKNKETIKIVSPSIIFFSLWTFILFLSVLNLYGLYKPSDEAYLLILLMNIFYFLGNVIYELIKKYKEAKLKEQNKINSETKNTKFQQKNKDNTMSTQPKFWNYSFIIFLVLSIIDIILLLIDCYIVVKNYNDGVPMWKIRRWRMEAFATADNPMLNRRSLLEESFRSIIIAPFEMILHPIVAYYFFNKKDKKRYILLAISITILVLSSIAGGGGRLGYIYYFGCYLLSYICMMKNNKKIPEQTKKKYKIMLTVLLILGVAIVIGFTMIRTDMSFLQQVYKYFALPPTLLSVWLPKINELGHTYGLLTFFGVHSYFFRFLDVVHLNWLIPSIYNDTYNYLLMAEDFVQSGFGVANAFVTPIYYFYIDGGCTFVCIASMIFGFIVSYAYKKICNNIQIRNFVIYMLIVYGVFVSFMRIQTTIPSYVIAFILAFLILKNEKEEK